MEEGEYKESFDRLMSEITAKRSWFSDFMLWLKFGSKMASHIRILEQERLFWLNEAMEWHAIRVASRPERDYDTFDRANASFLFCKNRHMIVCNELQDYCL